MHTIRLLNNDGQNYQRVNIRHKHATVFNRLFQSVGVKFSNKPHTLCEKVVGNFSLFLQRNTNLKFLITLTLKRRVSHAMPTRITHILPS